MTCFSQIARRARAVAFTAGIPCGQEGGEVCAIRASRREKKNNHMA